MGELPKRIEEDSWKKPATIVGLGAGTATLGYGAHNLRYLANPLAALPPQTPAAPGLLARTGGAVLRGGANLLAKPLGLLAKHPVAAAVGGALLPNNSIATDAQEQQHMKQAASYELPAGYESATPEERGKMLTDPNFIAKAREQTVTSTTPATPVSADAEAAPSDTHNPAVDFNRVIQRPAAGTGGPSQWSREDGNGNYARGEIPDVSGKSDLELANEFMRGHVDRWNAAPYKPGVTPSLKGQRGFGGYDSEDKVPWDMKLSNGFTVRQMIDAKKNMGKGTFSVLGGGAEGVSPEQWNNLSQQEATALRVRDLQGQIAAQQQLNAVRQGGVTGPASVAQPQRRSDGVTVVGAPSWNEALKDYASGRVGSEGYKMIRNFVGRTSQTFDGREVPDIGALSRLKTIKQLAQEEMGQGGRGGQQATDPLDAQRFLLDQSKFGYQQAKDARELALQEEEFKHTKGTSDAERRASFMSGFSYPDEHAPRDELGALTWSLSQSTGGTVPPELMAAYIQRAAKENKVNWKNAPPESLVELGKHAMAMAAKEYGG